MTKNNSEIVLYQAAIKTTLTLSEDSKKQPVLQTRNISAKKEPMKSDQSLPLFYEIKIRGQKYDLF